MKTAHLRRFVGGDLGGPLRVLPQEWRGQSPRSNRAGSPPRIWTVLMDLAG